MICAEGDPWETTRAELLAKYGQPERVDLAMALAALGKPGYPAESAGLFKGDLFAWRYSSREAAEAFAAANREYRGLPSLGITETEEGVFGVLDIRPALKNLNRITGYKIGDQIYAPEDVTIIRRWDVP